MTVKETKHINNLIEKLETIIIDTDDDEQINTFEEVIDVLDKLKKNFYT